MVLTLPASVTETSLPQVYQTEPHGEQIYTTDLLQNGEPKNSCLLTPASATERYPSGRGIPYHMYAYPQANILNVVFLALQRETGSLFNAAMKPQLIVAD